MIFSPLAGGSPARAQDVYLCVWRNPERTMTRIFPDALDYITVNARISEAQRATIEARLGFELLPGQQDQFQYFKMTGEDGRIIGTIIPAAQKGRFGAVEFVLGLGPDLAIRNLYIQRARERDQRFKEREFLDLFVGRSPAEASTLHRLYEGEETPGTAAVIRGLQKELVTYQVLVLEAGADRGGQPPSAAAAASGAAPADAFLARIAALCGRAYAGRVIADRPEQADNPFAGRALVMHVRECAEGELKIPFHVGDDRSRTWVLTRTATGLRLKHDHRHEDGSDDAVTMYGGDTAAPGTAARQEFPVDAFSIEMFEREGLAVSVTNTWALEIEPGRRFLYELSRPGGRLFQVEFDLSVPVETPPAPWGHPPLE